MCGLSGVLSQSISYNEENMFRDLLNISSTRGFQGSGAIVYQKPSNIFRGTGTIRTIRSKHISGALAYSDELGELLRPSCSALVGHARWPTKGGTDEKALHPHRFDHITGVHNGTLWKAAGQDVKDQSDSAMFFRAVAEVGIREAIRETRGAYAFIWVDEDAETLNFLRNSQRTLFFKNIGYNKNIQTLFWASEVGMLDFVFGRSYKHQNVWDTFMPEDTLISYPLKPSHIIRPVEVIKDFKPDPFQYRPVQTPRPGMGRGTVREWDGPMQEMAWDYQTNRYVPIDNVIALPPPKPSVPSVNTAETKTQQKKRLKRELIEAKKEERRRLAEKVREAAAKNRHDFQRPAKNVDEPVDTTTEAEAPANPVTPPWEHNHGGSRGNIDQVRSALYDDDHEVDLLGQRIERDETHTTRYARGYYGRGCAWCGEIANAGDRVHPVGSDLGGPNEFVCSDCSKNDDCAPWLSNETVYVTMD